MQDSKFFSSTQTIRDEQPQKKKGKKVAKGVGVGLLFVIIVGIVLSALAYVFAFKPAYALLANVNEINKDINNIKQAMGDRDLVTLNTYLDETQTDLQDLRVARDNNIGWTKDFGPTASYYVDSEHFINAGLYVVDALRETVVLITPFADAGGFKISAEQEVQETGLAEAFSQWISIMPQIADDSDVVLEKLSMAGEELANVDVSKYPENFRGQPIRELIEGAKNTLLVLNDAAPDIKQALVVLPQLLGTDGTEKRYMIVMQNDIEQRATGGFWTYLSTFKLRNALLSSDFTSYGTYNIDFTLDAIDPYYTFPSVPGAYRDHLKVERLFARDANISPDLPTAVDQFMLFWKLAMPLAPTQFKTVDGVVTINTQVLEELLEITGPVTLNGITYDASTVTLELEKVASLTLREQADRKKILGDLMEQMLINVFESDKNLWPKLIEKGMDLARRKHIQGVVFEPEAQALLEKYNLSGRIINPESGDYSFLVSTNLGGGKTNRWFVTKEVDHTLTQEGDRYVRTVTAKFTYGDKGPEYDMFKTRYQDWVRLYVPLGSELISLDGSEDPATTTEENDKTVFSGYLTLGPGEVKEISFKYYLPAGVVTDGMYKLYLQKQSGINTEIHRVTVNGQTMEFNMETDEEYSTAL